MSKVEYSEDKRLKEVVDKIITTTKNPALNALREKKATVISVLKCRTNNDGEREQNPGPPAKIQKVNDLWKLFVPSPYILIVDEFFFTTAGRPEAVIFNALCEVNVQVKEGEVKLGTRKPDISVFHETIQEYGAFDDILLGLHEWMDTAKTKAAQSFVSKVSTGNVDDTPTAPPTDEEEDPPRVHSGPPEEETRGLNAERQWRPAPACPLWIA
jgi:hypothetical protein